MKTAQTCRSLALVASFALMAIPESAGAQDASRHVSSVDLKDTEAAGTKSESTATLLALAGTAVPITAGILIANSSEGEGSDLGVLLVATGLYFGPVLGYSYAGSAPAGLKGTAVRLGISLATAGAAAAICSSGECDIFGDGDALWAAGILSLVGIGVATYSLIHDIAGVDAHARAYNARQAAERGGPRLTIAPVVSPRDGGTVGFAGRLRL